MQLCKQRPGPSRCSRRGQDRGRCHADRGGAQALPRQARRVRPRRRAARQISRPREVLLGARERLRLLRRGARLGFERPALRQRQLHRLAHRLSGRAVPHRAGDLPRAAARRRHAVLPRRVRRAGRGDLPARHAAGACSSAPPDMGYAAQASCEYEFFLFEETPHSVREKGFRNLQQRHARLLRLFDAARLGARRVLRASARAVRR